MFDERTKWIVAKAAHDDTLATHKERKRLVNFVRDGIATSDIAISVKEAAAILGLARRTVHRLCSEGVIKPVCQKPGNRMKNVSLASVEQAMERPSAFVSAKHVFTPRRECKKGRK